MRAPLKLSAIDQEHLQELYDGAGVARDELPYTEAYDKLAEGFQDRTFKNAHPEQLFAAMVKYVRSSSNPSTAAQALKLTDDQLKQLKLLIPRHAKGGKLLPYSDEIEALLKEFNKLSGSETTPHELWLAVVRTQGPKRRPPAAAKVAVVVEDDDDGE